MELKWVLNKFEPLKRIFFSLDISLTIIFLIFTFCFMDNRTWNPIFEIPRYAKAYDDYTFIKATILFFYVIYRVVKTIRLSIQKIKKNRKAKTLLFKCWLIISMIFGLEQNILWYIDENILYNFLFFNVYNRTNENIVVKINDIEYAVEENTKLFDRRTLKDERRDREKMVADSKIPLTVFNIKILVADTIVSDKDLYFPDDYISTYSAYGGLTLAILVENIDTNNFNISYHSDYDGFNSNGLKRVKKEYLVDRVYKTNYGIMVISP